MALDLTDTLGGVLDTFHSLFAKPGTTLQLYLDITDEGAEDFDGVNPYKSIGEITSSWFSYPKSDKDSNSLEVVIMDTAGVAPIFEALESNDHVYLAIGPKLYKTKEVPARPIAVLDAVRYWLISCDPEGRDKPAGV